MKPFIKYTFLAIVTLLALANTASAATISRPMHHNGLVGYWAFDLGKGGLTAYDTSGQGNNGTLTGMDATTDWVDGQIAGALDFDGVNDYVSVPQAASITTDLTNVTVAVWLKTTGNNDGAGVLGCLFGEDASGNGYMRLDDKGSESGNPKFISDIEIGGTADARTVRKVTPTGTWAHFVYTYDGAQEVLYVDGIGTSFAKTGALHTNTECGLYIGRLNSIGNYYDGNLDEARIYNRALSAPEITRLFNLGKQKFTAPDNTGLVGYWKFEEGTGRNAGDSSTNSNTGILNNMTEADWVEGKRGTALDFDGSNDYVIVTDNDTLEGTGEITISSWFKANVLESGGRLYFVDKKTLWSGSSGYSLGLENGTKIILLGSGSNSIAAASLSLNVGEWYHVVAVANGSNGVMYINGVDKTTDSTLTTIIDNSLDVWIGNRRGDGYFDGKLDEVRIYDRALSAPEIEKLFKAGQTKFNSSRNNRLTDGLVGLWSFDGKDMSNNTAFDRSGQGNDGTLTSGPIRTIGKIGQALNFDGVDDVVSVPDTDILSPSSEITISAWIKRNSLTGRQFFISKGQASTNAATEYWLEIASDNGLIFHLVDGSTSHKLTGATSITDTTTWHHVVGTWDGTTQKLYVDGVQDAVTVTWSGSINNTTYELALGNRSSNHDIEFNGVLDEVRIYNRALSADEISQLYDMSR